MIYILQHYTNSWSELAKISYEVSMQYCKKHSYEFLGVRVPDYDKYSGMEKLELYDQLSNGDIGFFMDCDSIVTCFSYKIEDFIDDRHDAYFSQGLNCGIFILKKTEWADYFIDWIKKEIKMGKANCEQDAVEHYVKLFPNDPKIKILPHPCFNSYPCSIFPEHGNSTGEQGCWQEGDFIIHVPAQSLQKRIEILKSTKITK